jgi:Aspartyl/Asparaginyl beta-hydroxylase
MRNFQHLASGLDVQPLLHAIQRQPGMWNADRTRTTFADSPHAAADDILVRFSDPAAPDVGDRLQCEWLPDAARLLPAVRPLVFALMARLEAEQLGRVVITRLAPGRSILPHADVLGEYSRFYSRYHVVLQGLPGSLFHCGDETVQMQTGEVWHFDAEKSHSVENHSADDRIHMLVDCRVWS